MNIKKRCLLASVFLITLSIDSIAQWEAIMPDTSIREVFVIDTSIIVGTKEGRIYKSDDFGQNWTKLASKLPGTIGNIGLSESNKMFCTSGRFVYASENWIDWDQVYQMNSEATCMAINGNKIFVGGAFDAGIHASFDDGETWSDITNDLIDEYLTSVTATDTTIIISLYSNNVHRSSNQGANWVDFHSGILEETVFSLGYNYEYFAGTDDKIYKHDGDSWIMLLDAGRQILDFAFDESIVCASGVGSTSKVFLSEDLGSTWSTIDAPTYIWAIDVFNEYLLIGTNNGLLKCNYQTVSIDENYYVEDLIGIFPNPVKDHLEIKLSVESVNPISVDIFDMSGNKLISDQFEPFTRIMNVDVYGLSDGIYIVTVTQGEKFSQSKFVK